MQPDIQHAPASPSVPGHHPDHIPRNNSDVVDNDKQIFTDHNSHFFTVTHLKGSTAAHFRASAKEHASFSLVSGTVSCTDASSVPTRVCLRGGPPIAPNSIALCLQELHQLHHQLHLTHAQVPQGEGLT